MSLLRHQSNSATIYGRDMSQVNYWVICNYYQEKYRKDDGAELLNVLPGPMEVKRGRFYLIDLYLMVIWDVVCCFG